MKKYIIVTGLIFLILAFSFVTMSFIACGDDDDDDATPTPTPTITPTPTPVETTFTNVSSSVGLTGVSAFRVSVADVNGDGYPDLLLHSPADEASGNVLDKQHLYLNVQGDNTGDPFDRKFVDFTNESGIRANRRGTNEGRHSSLAAFADVDNDGDLDMFSGLYYHRLSNYTDIGDRNDLYINDGTGRFSLASDTTFHDAGLLNTSGATFLDYDLDGNIDIFVGNWFLDYYGNENDVYSMDRLYRGFGDGSFAEVTDLVGMAREQPSYAVTAADWNYDGYVDLFAANYCRGNGFHWQNNGNGTFTEVGDSTNYRAFTRCSWGCMPRDFDNDGDCDFFEVYVHGYNSQKCSRLMVNNNNIFTWEGRAEGRIVGRSDEDPGNHNGDHYGSWIDANNDGLADFVITECGYSNDQVYYFQQSADHVLTAMTAHVHLDAVNTGIPPHNATPLDYDCDGDEDLLIGFASNDTVALMRNDKGNLHNWVAVTLQGQGTSSKSNRSAIGARVVVTAGDLVQTRSVYTSNGHFSPQIPLRLTFGLGHRNHIDSIVVHWPNAAHSTTTLTDVEVNQHLYITEE